MRFLTDGRRVPNVAKVCGKDASRPVLMACYLDADRAVLEATDSYKLVSVPVEVAEGDVSGLIPAAAVAALVKTCGKRSPGGILDCSDAGRVSLADGSGVFQTWPRPDGQWPDIPRLIPAEDARSGFQVRLNAKLLLELAQGLGGEDVTLTFTRSGDHEEGEGVGYFPAALRPIVVHNGSVDHGVGVLMPIRIAG